MKYRPDPHVIKDVADTAYWIAHLRAAESARADALFRDPLAGRLAGEHGREVSAAMPMERMIGWTVAIRTRIIDDYIQQALREGVDCVLNLGAGLDTRPYRMDLPAALLWLETDYPRTIEYKERLLAGETPRCRLERVKIDLADPTRRREFLAGVSARTGRMLALTEGVVPYLSNDQAASLADDLRALDHAACWVVDYMSAEAVKYRQRRGMGRALRNAPFRFAPSDWFAFFLEHGWRSRQIRYLAEEGERLGRPIPLPWSMKIAVSIVQPFLPPERKRAMRRFMGYALMVPA